ncbi:tRNA pseudouridine(55) synthase TruB [Amphibacillus sediminis]|uniref:tRNA pseudouridine(55) synthase TruB n=1 Tax=Amphibacillus sediminis TaxID=360185 RepID=UPI00083514AB|nr:tRNA pseudouridine(55) synthase TruB [Amphibacillus sediminis]
MNGIVPLWKPVGMTSHDCVVRLRRIFATKKVGHTGTLDPEVQGVLPICIGEATKIVPYLTDTSKTYLAEVTLGYATDTEDQTGKVIEQTPVNKGAITETVIERVLLNFLGQIEQVTPLYSAVKVNGKRLYQYARENQPVERPIRQVRVDDITYIEHSLSFKSDRAVFQFQATVSKGTYIRTLSVDIGKALGYPAHMSQLIRTGTADFTKKQTYTLEQLEQLKDSARLTECLYPIQSGLSHLPVYQVNEKLVSRVLNGQKLSQPDDWNSDRAYRVEHKGKLLAIYQSHPTKAGEIKPLRVFNSER